MNIHDAIAAYTQARGLRLARATIADYQVHFRRLAAAVGDADITAITPAHVAHVLTAMETGDKTRLNAHTALASLWHWLVDNGHAAHNIVTRIQPPRPIARIIQPYTRAEVVAMLAAAASGRQAARDTAIVLCLLDTGLRASELCGLRWADWMPDGLRVSGKGGRERIVPIGETAARAARGLAPAGGLGYVFISRGRGRPLTRAGLKLLVGRLAHRAGVASAHPHRFRHTFALTFLRAGGDIYSLQRILGHSSLVMVQRYLALAQGDITAAHRRASPVAAWGLGAQLPLPWGDD